jgi:hypothetical protein
MRRRFTNGARVLASLVVLAAIALASEAGLRWQH